MVDEQTWRLVYRAGDPVLIAAVCIITAQVRRVVPVARRHLIPLIPLLLGAAAALAVQQASPHELKLFVIWRRMITYAGGAALAWSLRRAWMPAALSSNGAEPE